MSPTGEIRGPGEPRGSGGTRVASTARRTTVPRVTAAAGCGGTGRELERYGELATLDAVLVGPIGPGSGPVAGPGRVRVTPSPSGLVHTSAPALAPDRVVAELLPWLRARSLRVVLAVRGASTGEVVSVLQRLRRSLDFGQVVGVEVDLTADREGTRVSVSGLAGSDPDAPWSTDPQATLKLLAAAREQLPRDLPLRAKLGGECPDPVATARAAVGGGARALVLSGGLRAATTVPGTGPQWLAGPAVAPLTAHLVTTMRAAMAAARVPDVPIIAVGGVRDVSTALALRESGAAGVQVGVGILSDPQLLWAVHEALADPTLPGPTLPGPTLPGPTLPGPTLPVPTLPTDPEDLHDQH